MKIAFNTDTELEIIESFDAKKDTITFLGNETFKAGEPVEVEILETDTPEYVDLQFGDGSLCMGVQKSCFTILSEN